MTGGALIDCHSDQITGYGGALSIFPPRVSSHSIGGRYTNRATLRGVQITGATAYNGGGLFAYRLTTVRIIDSIVSGCTGGWGAALYGQADGSGKAAWVYVTNTVVTNSHAVQVRHQQLLILLKGGHAVNC